MGEVTKIEWADHTFNPVIGCTKVSAGCDRCYAEALMDVRWGKVKWGPHGERVRTSPENWLKPLRWDKAAGKAGVRPRVLCASLADVFDNQWPEGVRADLFDLIVKCQNLDWLPLTKRPENIEKMLKAINVEMPLPNVWLGTTAEDQENFDHRWPILQRIPAAKRFISYEPAIGPLRLLTRDTTGLDWVICGGESGHGYRGMEMQWEYDIRRDCELKGISYFFKQLAGKRPIPASMTVVRQFPCSS
jgi:protein gp37